MPSRRPGKAAPRAESRLPALLPKTLSPSRSSPPKMGTVLFPPPIESPSATDGDSLLPGIRSGEVGTVFIRIRPPKHCPHLNPVPSEMGTVFVPPPIDGRSAPDRDSPVVRKRGNGMGTVLFRRAPSMHCPQFNAAPLRSGDSDELDSPSRAPRSRSTSQSTVPISIFLARNGDSAFPASDRRPVRPRYRQSGSEEAGRWDGDSLLHDVRLQSTVPSSILLPFEVGTVLSWPQGWDSM